MRRELLARRDALGEHDRAARSQQISDDAIALLASRLPEGSLVALYAAKGSEVDTTALDLALRLRNLRVAYPRVVHDVRALDFHEIALEELVVSRFGLREPPKICPTVELAELSAVIMPGLAFDRSGGRIGWGRGHYDATLAAVPGALRVGLAFDCQLIERVPSEPHDALLHILITELATHVVA